MLWDQLRDDDWGDGIGDGGGMDWGIAGTTLCRGVAVRAPVNAGVNKVRGIMPWRQARPTS